MKTLNLETTAPFQGLSELVAYDEGLFAEEGIDITWVDRDPTENVVSITKTINTDIKDPSEVNPHSSHGVLFEQGKADMYNACEWGNYCRVQDSGVESGRTGFFTLLIASSNSPGDVFTGSPVLLIPGFGMASSSSTSGKTLFA